MHPEADHVIHRLRRKECLPMENAGERKDKLVVRFTDNRIDTLLVMRAIKSKPVEEAFRAVPRHLFVDRYYPKKRAVRFNYRSPTQIHLERIYSDRALITHRGPPSSTSQPSLVANMLEELLLEPGMNVLDWHLPLTLTLCSDRLIGRRGYDRRCVNPVCPGA